MIYVHGVIPDITAIVADGEAQPLLTGWHVNSDVYIVGLDGYRVHPAAPYNVIAGADTYYYRFDDEAQWLAVAEEFNLITEVSNGGTL